MDGLNQAVSSNIGILVLAIGLIAVAGLAAALRNRSQVTSVAGRFKWIAGDQAGEADTLGTLLGTLKKHSLDITQLQNQVQQNAIDARAHFQRIGLVRYDAFDGVAGQQSYSLCLLDANGNGILITTLVGTNFSRGYAVDVREGQPARKLGDEEAEALNEAVTGQRAPARVVS